MRKVDQIEGFIRKNKPRRKDLIRFIVCDMNKIDTHESYDKSSKGHRGYYSTAIAKFIRAGNVEIKNGKYCLTKQAKTHDKGLYHKPLKIQLAEEKARARQLWIAYREERDKNFKLRDVLKDIGHIIDISLD